MPGFLTAAVMAAYCAAALKPDGRRADSVVSPSPDGRNSVTTELAPPGISSRGAAIVPTDGFELITSILIEDPPATACSSTNWSEESRRAEKRWIGEACPRVVVLNFGI